MPFIDIVLPACGLRNLQEEGETMLLTSFVRICRWSLQLLVVGAQDEPYQLTSEQFSCVLSAQRWVWWNASSGTAWAELLITFTNFIQRKETTWQCLQRWMSAKQAVCTTPGIAPIFLPQHALVYFMLWLKPTMKQVWTPCGCLFLHDKGIRLTMVAKWTRGLHMGPTRRLKTPGWPESDHGCECKASSQSHLPSQEEKQSPHEPVGLQWSVFVL